MTDFGSETFELSVGEFNQLQQQIVNLKTENHDLRMYKEQQETSSRSRHRLRPLSTPKNSEPEVIADFDDPLSSNIRKINKPPSNDNGSEKKIGQLEKKLKEANGVKSKLEKEKKGFVKERQKMEKEKQKLEKENDVLLKTKANLEKENVELINSLSKVNTQQQDELKKREGIFEARKRELEESIDTFKSDQEMLVQALKEKYLKECEKAKNEVEASWKKKLETETASLKKEIKQLNDKTEKMISQEKKKLESAMKKNTSKEMKAQSEKFEKKLSQEKKKLESELKKKHGGDMKNLGEKSDRRFETERKKYDMEKKKIESFFQEKVRREVKNCQTELNKRFDMERKKHAQQVQLQNEKLEKKFDVERKKFELSGEKMKKEIAFFKKKKNSHKKKKNESRYQVKQLNVLLENVRKNLSDAREEILGLKNKEVEQQKKIGHLEEERDDLDKSRNGLLQELEGKSDIQKQLVSEKSVLERKLHSERQKYHKSKKNNEKKRSEIEKLRSAVGVGEGRFAELQMKYDHDYISMYVHRSLQNFQICHTEGLNRMLEEQLSEEKTKNQILEGMSEKNEAEIRNLKNNVEDLQTENQIAQKHNIREIRDLKRHLSRYRSQNENLERKNKELLSGEVIRRNPSSHHIRTQSSPSDPSHPRAIPRERNPSAPSQPASQNGSTIRPSPLPNRNQSKKKNTIAQKQQQQTRKQNKNINKNRKKKKNISLLSPSEKMEELKKQLRIFARRVKVLEDQNIHHTEKLEQKTKIISDYMKREKLGRIHEEIIPPKQPPVFKISNTKKNRKQKKKKKKKKKILKNEIVDPDLMQKIMEETLVKNIQLHDNLKTMGTEVDRLLKENEQLRREREKREMEEVEGEN